MFSDKTDTATNGSSESSSDLLNHKRRKRLTFDLDAKKHSKVKMAALHEDKLVKEILNEAIDEWMKKRGYL